ncbi:MAG: hypothetical protein IJY04_02610, partial [Clostridia bacterium]|nr:hypothetical protein [Clostridia bacterium]
KYLSLFAALMAVLCVLFCMTAVSVFADENTETGDATTEGGTTEGDGNTETGTPDGEEDGGETVPPCTTHTFDNDCDAECNVCGATRTPTHKYDNACDKECNVCKATRETTHKYDNNCDTDCNVCKETRSITHTYDNDCDKDCNVCKKTRTTTHKYDGEDDPECNVCKATREIPTAFEKWWDANNQWVGYVVAGIIFVGGAIGVFLWIPKNKDMKKKSK